MFSNKQLYPSNSFYNNQKSFQVVSHNQRNQYMNMQDPKQNYFIEDPSLSDSRTYAETQSQISFNRRKPTEEMNNMFISLIESTIPKIADQCANIVMKKIEPNFKNQIDEISSLNKEISLIRKRYDKQKLPVKYGEEIEEKLRNQLNFVIKSFKKCEETLNDNKCINLHKTHENDLISIKESLYKIKDQMFDAEDSNSKILDFQNEIKTNVIFLKRQIDEKMLPLDNASSILNKKKEESNFSEKDLFFLQELSEKFDKIYKEITNFSIKANNITENIKPYQLSDSSMAIDDFSTNISSFSNMNSYIPKRNNRLSKITCFANIKPF